MLIIGPTGTGKSVHVKSDDRDGAEVQRLHLHLRYWRHYESVVELYGVGSTGWARRPPVNPFSLEPTESNIQVSPLLCEIAAHEWRRGSSPEDDDLISQGGAKYIPARPATARLSNLFLPKHLDRYHG